MTTSPRLLLAATAVRDALGGISDMSLWRWLHNPEMQFPKPIYIGRRRYWRETEINAWLDAQCERAA